MHLTASYGLQNSWQTGQLKPNLPQSTTMTVSLYFLSSCMFANATSNNKTRLRPDKLRLYK